MAEFKFYHVTDCHTLSINNPLNEEDYQEALKRSAVLDAVYDYILADDSIDTVIISGDNSQMGRPDEHKEFIERTRKLTNGGKNVYNIIATHDFGLVAVNSDGSSEPREDTVNRKDLREMYEEFGYNKAISEFERYSYVVKPCEGFRLLCLNDDGDGIQFRGYSEEQKKWIEEQVKECYAAGDFPVVTTHHPALPPNVVYPIVSENNMLGDYKNTSKFFADIGVKYAFTGHTHMHSIRSITTEKGNTFYDINTGAISEYPLVFRKVTIKNGEADIETIHIPNVNFDTNGKTPIEYYTDRFDELILGAIHGMAHDYDEFVYQAGRIEIKPEPLWKLQRPLKIVGKYLDKVTMGGLGRLLLCSSKVDKSIKDDKFKYLLAAFLRNVYGGDEPYGPHTPQHKAMMAYLNRLKPIYKKFLKGTPFEDLPGLLTDIIYDPTPDSNAHLK